MWIKNPQNTVTFDVPKIGEKVTPRFKFRGTMKLLNGLNGQHRRLLLIVCMGKYSPAGRRSLVRKVLSLFTFSF